MSESHVDGSGVLININDAAHSTGHAHGVDIYATRKSHRHSQSRVGDKLFTTLFSYYELIEFINFVALTYGNSYGSRTCEQYKT